MRNEMADQVRQDAEANVLLDSECSGDAFRRNTY